RACLDPGHGGTDPGATAGGLVEKELNLDIAQRVRALLDATLYNVTLTRSDNNTTLGNSARAQICNAAGAQLVLSIHFTASTDTPPFSPSVGKVTASPSRRAPTV